MNRSRILTSVDYSEQLANNLDQLDKHANKIDTDQISSRQTNELSSSSKMVKVSFMAEVCTELAITKNLAITDTFLCHDEGDVILSTFGFYSPSDAKHAAGVNLLCSALDGLSDYNRTAGYQNIYVKDLTLSMLVATTGSKMSSTLQMMHQKKENLGILGRLNIWHLQSLNEFVPPRHSKLVSDIASIDHLFIIAHEIYQHNPEFRFKKHATDTVTQVVIDDVDNDEYMKSLRLKQGIDGQNEPILSSNDDDTNDVFNVCSNDLTDDGGVISAYKLMLSILDSYFKTAQQMDRHSSGCVPKGLSKFPRACSLLYLLEIISGIASNLLKYISFDEGNFSRPHSKSKKFISMEFVHAARQHVKIYLLNLPSINNRPITYIDKSQVERAHIFYSYVETTMNMLFDASFINYTSQIDRETTSVNYLSKTMVHGGLLKSDNYLSITKSVSYVKLPPSTLRQNEDLLKLFNKFGPSFTLNSYEKMFEKFGLVTAADATIVPITFKGIVLLREDNAFVNFYHCLDKDEGVLKMIQERITSKEINLVHDYKDGPYRYELVIENEKIVNISSNDSNENNNENIKNGILTTDVNSSIVHNSMINVNQHFNTQAIQEQDILSMLSTQDNNMLLSATNVHPQSTNQIQRHNCGVSSASSDSRVSVSSVSPSFDHANFMQSTPRASSPIPAMLFQSLLNIDENSTASNIQFDNLSSIIDEPTSSPTNAAFNTSSIMIRLHSPIPEPARLVQQTLSPKSANDNMDLTSVTSHETYQENNLSTHQTNDEAQKRFSSQSVIPSPVSSNFHSQTYRVLSQLSDAIQLESNVWCDLFCENDLVQCKRSAQALSCETSISFPKSFQPEARPIFIEQNLPFIFHIFTVFWSNHRMLNGIKCKEKLCSRVMLIDGHQKCQRIICQFENLINMNHPEMGPVVQGCPYAPNRKKKNEKGNVIRTFTHSDQSVFYCSHHAKYVDMTKNGEQHHTNQYEEANKIDQQTIAELNNEDMCNVYRSDIRTDQKNRSFGLLVTFLSCNVAVSFTESIKSEGCRRVT
ncbi:unnamed protein product, partial [Rotaria socialis]